MSFKSDNQRYKGGLEDLGNFKEGFCFRLTTNFNTIWDLCAGSMNEKDKWMQAIYSIMQKSIRNSLIRTDSLFITKNSRIHSS